MPHPLLRIRKGFSYIELLVVLFVLGIVYFFNMPIFEPPAIFSRVQELVLSASFAKAELTNGFREHHSWSASWMSDITISTTGVVASATINPYGQIKVYGTRATSNSVVTLTPTTTTDNRFIWICTGSPEKYMPAACRQ